MAWISSSCQLMKALRDTGMTLLKPSNEMKFRWADLFFFNKLLLIFIHIVLSASLCHCFPVSFYFFPFKAGFYFMFWCLEWVPIKVVILLKDCGHILPEFSRNMMTSFYSNKYVCVYSIIWYFPTHGLFCGHVDLELMYNIIYFSLYQCLRAVVVQTSLLVHDCCSVLYTVWKAFWSFKWLMLWLVNFLLGVLYLFGLYLLCLVLLIWWMALILIFIFSMDYR